MGIDRRQLYTAFGKKIMTIKTLLVALLMTGAAAPAQALADRDEETKSATNEIENQPIANLELAKKLLAVAFPRDHQIEATEKTAGSMMSQLFQAKLDSRDNLQPVNDDPEIMAIIDKHMEKGLSRIL